MTGSRGCRRSAVFAASPRRRRSRTGSGRASPGPCSPGARRAAGSRRWSRVGRRASRCRRSPFRRSGDAFRSLSATPSRRACSRMRSDLSAMAAASVSPETEITARNAWSSAALCAGVLPENGPRPRPVSHTTTQDTRKTTAVAPPSRTGWLPTTRRESWRPPALSRSARFHSHGT